MTIGLERRGPWGLVFNLHLHRKYTVFTFPICLFGVILEKLVEIMEGHPKASFGVVIAFE